MIQFEVLARSTAVTEPFTYMVCKDLLSEKSLRHVSADFPAIDRPGVFPLSELRYGPAFADLIHDISSREMENLLAQKFDIDLSDHPLMITVRGQPDRATDASIPTRRTRFLPACFI